jgi:PII-like signaling protein
MSQVAALRLYFPLSARARKTRFWHHLTAPALGRHLLNCARRAHLEQAVMHGVQAGYLPGDKLTHEQIEHVSGRMPQCIELIDTEGKLHRFLHDHADELVQVRAVLYLCELPLVAERARHPAS